MLGDMVRSGISGVPWVPISRPDLVLDIPAEEFGIDIWGEGGSGGGRGGGCCMNGCGWVEEVGTGVLAGEGGS